MEILQIIFGTLTLIMWFFCAVFALVGFAVYKALLFKRRTEKCSSFDLRFWWEDNKIEFILGVVSFWLLTRFHEDIAEAVTSQFGFPMIKNILLFNLLFGLLFQMGLKKMRGYFRLSEDASGDDRKPMIADPEIKDTNIG